LVEKEGARGMVSKLEMRRVEKMVQLFDMKGNFVEVFQEWGLVCMRRDWR
jgi:hypothetical protein